ncbi:MAG: menaquinol-cytochrome c reductase cytochrome b subunit, partial [Acidimicrobiaceae bacterium]|nr:menaquinol-cytochrome c reductase cytochrome b subunit [Acidimicrobiaceae bacterium]
MARLFGLGGRGNGSSDEATKERKSPGERLSEGMNKFQGSQFATSIFRPGSIFRKGYTDSPRNRSYV